MTVTAAGGYAWPLPTVSDQESVVLPETNRMPPFRGINSVRGNQDHGGADPQPHAVAIEGRSHWQLIRAL